MHSHRLTTLLCGILLPLLPQMAASEEEGAGGEIGLAKTLLPDDQELLKKTDEAIIASLEGSLKTVTENKSKAVLREMKALLAAKRMPIAKEEELHGAWKVRSLQAGRLGAYSYPFFDCRIFPEAKALVFHKSKGSQRRFGFLERDSKERFLFAGAMYFTYDPKPRMYKGTGEDVAKEDPERNSVAWLYKIAGKRLIMVFPSSGADLEIYELKR